MTPVYGIMPCHTCVRVCVRVCVCVCVRVCVSVFGRRYGGTYVPWGYRLADRPRIVAREARRDFAPKVRKSRDFALSRTVATKIAPERPCGAVSAYHGRNLANHFQKNWCVCVCASVCVSSAQRRRDASSAACRCVCERVCVSVCTLSSPFQFPLVCACVCVRVCACVSE
jgi:hypothetical protein